MTDEHGPVEPYSLQEVLELEETYWKWAYFQARDEDCKQDYQGEHATHIRLIETAKRLMTKRKLTLGVCECLSCRQAPERYMMWVIRFRNRTTGEEFEVSAGEILDDPGFEIGSHYRLEVEAIKLPIVNMES